MWKYLSLDCKVFVIALIYMVICRFLKPLLTNSRPNLMETCPGCCMPLAKMLTTKEQMMQVISKSGVFETTINSLYHEAKFISNY